jgi:hypothetical protein
MSQFNSHQFIKDVQKSITNTYVQLESSKSNRGSDGYYFSTDICIPMCEIKRLTKLSETYKWFQLRESEYSPTYRCTKGLWLNPDYGNVQNAWHIYSHGSIVFHNSYPLKTGITSPKELMRRYKYWYQTILDMNMDVIPLFQLIKQLGYNIINTSESYLIPFIAPLVGFDELQRVYLKYKAVAVTVTNNKIGIVMKYHKREPLVDEQRILFSRRVHIPESTIVPVDYLVFNFQPKWNDWVDSYLY